MIEPLLDPDCFLEERKDAPPGEPLGEAVLKSRRFGDIYFSGEDGLAETKCVFIEGNDIPERLKQTQHFVIAETGFGTGLNFLAVMAEIAALGDAAPHLHFISTEIAPLSAEMIEAALAPWPQLAPFRQMLTRDLPPRWPGRHRRHFLDGRVTLDLLYGDSVAMLAQADFTADCWFLDGFTPARNPLMWRRELYSLMAERSSAATTLASFTAAGDVRRRLEAAGFEVSRHSGFGGKRHRITGVFNGDAGRPYEARSHDPGRVVVMGAGIAGASVAAALKRRGLAPHVVSAGVTVADGASGNIAAVQAPRLTATDTAEARFSLTAWGYARYQAKAAGASLADQTVLLAHDERETLRQQKISNLGWPETVFTPADAAAARETSGIDTGLGGMVFTEGGTVDPAAFVKSGLDDIDLCLETSITAISRDGDGFVLHHQGGEIVADTLIMAAGAGFAALAEPFISDCRFQITAGHVTHLEATAYDLHSGLSFGGYMARAADGTIALGASFDHHDPAKPLPPRGKAAHQANVDLLPEAARDHLPAPDDHLPGRTSLRIASPDRQPVAGRLGEGLYVLSGLGARGMVTAPILGEYIASLVLGLPSPLDKSMEAVVDPGRFSARAKRRQSGSSSHPSAK